jgi:hypothetical protein
VTLSAAARGMATSTDRLVAAKKMAIAAGSGGNPSVPTARVRGLLDGQAGRLPSS